MRHRTLLLPIVALLALGWACTPSPKNNTPPDKTPPKLPDKGPSTKPVVKARPVDRCQLLPVEPAKDIYDGCVHMFTTMRGCQKFGAKDVSPKFLQACAQGAALLSTTQLFWNQCLLEFDSSCAAVQPCGRSGMDLASREIKARFHAGEPSQLEKQRCVTYINRVTKCLSKRGTPVTLSSNVMDRCAAYIHAQDKPQVEAVQCVLDAGECCGEVQRCLRKHVRPVLHETPKVMIQITQKVNELHAMFTKRCQEGVPKIGTCMGWTAAQMQAHIPVCMKKMKAFNKPYWQWFRKARSANTQLCHRLRGRPIP